MKKTITIALIIITSISYAQLFSKEKIKNKQNFDKQFLSWGYYLGFNIYDFKFTYEEDLEDILVDTSTGFQLGLIGNMRINDYFDLRLEPGVFFTNMIDLGPI